MRKVCVLQPNNGWVTAKHADSWARLHTYERGHAAADTLLERKITKQAYINICKTQNELVVEFLETSCDWALMLESDIVFPMDLLPRMVLEAEEHNLKILGALYIQPNRNIPLIFDQNGQPIQDYPNKRIRVASTGVGCLLIHRSVLEDDLVFNGNDWFLETYDHINQQWLDADTNFCWRVANWYDIWVDCRLHVGHDKYGKVWYPNDIPVTLKIREYA